MKNLRHLLRRTGWLNSQQRRRRSQASQRGTTKRRLSSEALERRQLLAGDLAFGHNYWHGADVDNNQQVTAKDALMVINHLSRDGSGAEITDASQVDSYVDVNADGRVTASDALTVINAINRGEAAGELIEMQLQARDQNDNALTGPDDRVVDVEVGQIFNLELSYEDLRTFGNDIGAFQVLTDIVFDQSGVITPVLTEAQQLTVAGEIRNATSGNFTFSLDGGSETYVSSLSDFANDPAAEISNALVALGYSTDQFKLTRGTDLTADPDDPNDLKDIIYRIHYVGSEVVGEDLPNLNVVADFDVPVPVQVVDEPPVNPDGSINGNALAFNLDLRSRTYNATEQNPFGAPFYDLNVFGTFDPVTGFDEVGGIGKILPFGIPEGSNDDDLLEPFDVFSIPVYINQPVTGLTIALDPAENEERVLLYPGDDAQGVPTDLIILDEDSRITVNATAVATGVSADDSSLTVTEGATTATTIDLSNLVTVNSGGEVISYSITGDPALGAATIDGSVLSYIPTGDNFGTDQLIYTAVNGDGGDTGTIAITITAENDPPVAVDDTGTTNQGNPVSLDVLDNDSFGPANEAQTLSVTEVTNGSNGTVAVNTDGTLTYSPAAGFSGTDTFTYTVSDGQATDVATVTVTVNAVEVGPSAGNATLTSSEGATTPSTIDLASLVTINSGGAASFTITTDGSRGTATLNGSILSYLPDADEFGSDTIVYTATNAEGSDTGTIAIDVAAENDPPVVVDDNVTTDEDVPVLTIDVLDNDTTGAANETDTLTVVSVGNPTNGTAIINDNGTLAYAPADDFFGTDTFTYTVSDGTDTVEGTVTVTVNAINDAPLASDDLATVIEDESVVVDVLDNDTTGAANENDTLNVVSATGGANGTATVNADNTITYVPNADFFGDTTFTYTLTDGEASDTATVVVTVTPENDAPIAEPDSATVAEDGSVTINVLDNDSPGAEEDDELTVQSATGATNGIAVINSDGTITYTPSANFVGTDSFTYVVSDGTATDATTVTVTVTDVLAPPVASNGSLTATEDAGTVTLDLSSLVALDSGDTATYVIADNASFGTAAIVGSTLSFTPDANAFGSDSIVYTATNASGSDSGTIAITINAVNDAPVANSDSASTVKNNAVTVDVLDNDTAGAANENDTLTVTAASGASNGSVVLNNNGTITYTPDADFTGTDSFTYTLSDGTETTQSTVTVNVNDFEASTISGSIFFDEIENIDEYAANPSSVTPIRSGDRNGDESGLGGVEIRLTSAANQNASGQAINKVVLTGLNGNYSIAGVVPGTYQVSYQIPETIIFGANVASSSEAVSSAGAGVFDVVIGEAGGVIAEDVSFGLLGTRGAALGNMAILSSTYLEKNAETAEMSAEGLQGGLVSLSQNGEQEFFLAKRGYEDVAFAELVLNSDRDEALLTIVDEDGSIRTARLADDQFVVNRDGTAVQFFGGKEDFDFLDADSDLASQEFEHYRDAIDRAMSQI